MAAFELQSLAQQRADIFAANRATGCVELSISHTAGRSRRKRVHEDGSLRVRFPHEGVDPLEAIFVNTAGGMTGGDDFSIDIAVGGGASFVAGTAAAEKVYRTGGPDTVVSVALKAADNSRLAWLPQETIMFDEARLSRRFNVDLAPTASLLMAEAVVFGRVAMGETVKRGHLLDRWRVRRDGKLIFADGVRLDGAIGGKLAEPAAAAGGIAIATVLAAPGDDAMVAAVRTHDTDFAGAVGISAWNGIAVARLCAADGASLRRDLSLILAALRAPMPRLWLN